MRGELGLRGVNRNKEMEAEEKRKKLIWEIWTWISHLSDPDRCDIKSIFFKSCLAVCQVVISRNSLDLVVEVFALTHPWSSMAKKVSTIS